MGVLLTINITFLIFNNLTINDWRHREDHLVFVINDRINWFVL